MYLDKHGRKGSYSPAEWYEPRANDMVLYATVIFGTEILTVISVK